MSANIIVTTKHQDIFDKFLSTFLPTTEGRNITLHVFHVGVKVPKHERIIDCGGVGLGNAVYVPYIKEEIIPKLGRLVWRNTKDCFGITNDDIVFTQGWYESVLEGFDYAYHVSPGYVNTIIPDELNQAVEKTKQIEGFVEPATGLSSLFKVQSFTQIGMLDKQFDWSGDDLDLVWRFLQRGLGSITMKKITIAHAHGESRNRDIARWRNAVKEGVELFSDKHGIGSYRELRKLYLGHAYYLKKLYNEDLGQKLT